MEGSCNISGGELLHLMSGNLSYQIEHHIFPDLPSNRYKEVSPRVQEICERYGIEYTTGPLWKQYGQVVRRITRFAFPGRAKNEQREIDPQRTSQRNPRVHEAADAKDRRKASGVRAAGARKAAPVKSRPPGDEAALRRRARAPAPPAPRPSPRPPSVRRPSQRAGRPAGTGVSVARARLRSGRALLPLGHVPSGVAGRAGGGDPPVVRQDPG